MMSWFQENYGAALSNPILQSVLIVWGAVIAAKITDLIFTRIFKRVVDKTQTSLDDQILQLLHRPIFYTILFIGFSVAVKTAGLPEYLACSKKHCHFLIIWARSALACLAFISFF